jgi:hypothetical protein
MTHGSCSHRRRRWGSRGGNGPQISGKSVFRASRPPEMMFLKMILAVLQKKVVRIFGQKVREISEDLDRMTKKGRRNFRSKGFFGLPTSEMSPMPMAAAKISNVIHGLKALLQHTKEVTTLVANFPSFIDSPKL